MLKIDIMKKYYVKSNVNMMPKNKAWKELQEFAYSRNGTLVHGDDAKELFISGIKTTIKEVNESNPRCTNIDFLRHQYEETVIIVQVGLDHVFSLSFLPVKEEFKTSV